MKIVDINGMLFLGRFVFKSESKNVLELYSEYNKLILYRIFNLDFVGRQKSNIEFLFVISLDKDNFYSLDKTDKSNKRVWRFTEITEQVDVFVNFIQNKIDIQDILEDPSILKETKKDIIYNIHYIMASYDELLELFGLEKL